MADEKREDYQVRTKLVMATVGIPQKSASCLKVLKVKTLTK